MRTYSPSFAYANLATEKYPRFVVGIIFETDSLYFTSHDDIPSVPGVVTQRVLTVLGARSQRIVPDEGRSEIGTIDFELLDLEFAVSSLFQGKLAVGAGLRGKKVVLYHGWAGAEFETFQVFQTQVIRSVSYQRGVYSIKCADISREQRKDIFDPKVTRLAASIDADDTSVEVANANAFEMIEHGDSFSDAPSSTVGYIRIDKEIIRYTGISGGNTFTGCTRGVLNTRAVPHVVDLTSTQDRRTEVKEVIYLELPVPKMILALLTGELYDQAAQLPEHWHLSIDPTWVRQADFTGIGLDLWDPSADAVSFVATFIELTKVDGKKFLESELYQLIGCYPLIYSDGTVGIKRMNRVLADAPFVGVINDSNIQSWSELTHDMESVANDYRVNWNHVDGKATRSTRLYDVQSIALHGAAKPIENSFKGLYGSRHTDSTVRALLDARRDRYAHPPARQSVKGMPHLNVLEVGDIVRNQLSHVRDYQSQSLGMDRSMEIQSTKLDLRTGDVELELFGSTGLASTQAGDDDGTGSPDSVPLDDAFYDSEGTELGTVVDLTEVGDVWEVDEGTWPLTGHADVRNPAAIYYHVGDLTISADAIFEITQNVQLRVMGHLTINGLIDGAGAGNAGVADPTGYGTSALGVSGFGSLRAMDGIVATEKLGFVLRHSSLAGQTTVGNMVQVPAFDLRIVDGSPQTLAGVPSDLRGSSGGPGGKIVYVNDREVLSVGGAGANGGAGLMIICRGLSFGASGQITLNGSDSAATTPVTFRDRDYLPGAGAPGAPGALLIVLDGQDLSYPDLSGGKFVAAVGASGAALQNTMQSPTGGAVTAIWLQPNEDAPWEGYVDPATAGGADLSNSAHRIQYLSDVADPGLDDPASVPAPSNLSATGVPNGILLEFDTPEFDQFDGIEVYMASSNDRSLASKVAEVKATSYLQPLAPATTRYFWIRARKANQFSSTSLFSEWEPTSSTGGASGTST